MSLIEEIHQYLAEELAAVNKLIGSNLFTEENLIQKIGLHLANAGGKRMRPMLTLLTAKIFDYQGKDAVKLATAIEFIHMATLLHDDVVDGSKLRRFIPTANYVWGNKASILVGDFLFSQSFKLIVSTKIQPALEILSAASAVISEGEVAQLSKLEEKKIITQDEYYKLITAKTAELFGAACEVGAVVADQLSKAQFLREFGLQLGIAFQISDDSLDYFGGDDELGKNLGDDFYEGKVTLPLIILSQKLTPKDHEKLQLMISSSARSLEDFMWVKSQLKEHQIINLIRVELNLIKDKALMAIEELNLDNNRPLRKLATEEQVQGYGAKKSNVHKVHEDLSTKSKKQLPSVVEFAGRSNLSLNYLIALLDYSVNRINL